MKKRKIFFILFMLLVVNITKSQMIHPDDYIIKHNKGWGFNNINTEPWKYKHQTKKKHASYRNLRFTIKFGDDCEYVMPYHGCASEQNRFQKVVTLCTHQRLTSKNHLKLGWRWNPVSGKVEVAFYGHLNHLSDNKNGREHIYLIKSVDTDEPLNIVMVIAKKGFYLRAGEKSAWIVRDVFSWKPNNDTEDNNDPGNEKTYMRANSYFSECEDPAFGVPHRMHFYLNNIYVDDPDIKEYTDNTDLTFFDTYMQYPDQGPYNYYASNDMVLPVPNQGASNRLPFTSPFFVIESGNTVNLVAGNSISLKQGFWAKAGCTFSAKIGSNPFKFSNSTACGFLKKNFTQENSPVAGNSIAFFNQSGTEITAISPAITDSLGYFAFDSAQIAGLDTNMLVTLNTREKQIDTGDVGFKTIKNWIRTNPIQLHIEDLGVAASNITYDSINPIMSYLIGNDTNFYYFFDEDNMYSNIYTDEYYSCLNDSVRLYANAYGGIKPYTYHWDFDNGNTSSLMKPVVKFNTAGIYNILLVATDAKGQKDTDLLVVKLIEPVQAAFDLVSPFCLYDTLKIINNTAGDSTTSYIWIVSNGDTIISNNLQYKFNQDGNFIITLIAIDSLCCSDTLTRQISILDCNLLSGTLTENPACGGAPVAGDTLALMKNDTAVASAITDENGAFSFNSADLAQLNTAALYGINTKSGFPLDSGQQKTIIQWQSESPLSLTLKNVNQQWVARYNGADSLNDVTSALDLQGNIYVTGATSSNITAYDMLT
ncbi:MAG: PKD domain-containing protein, partial [Bacteroidales bacterium]